MLELLEELSQGSVRILRAVADESGNAGGVRYEIFHDVLAAPILDWRRRHVAEAQRAEHEAKQREADRMRVEAEEEARSERRRARIFRALAIAAAVFAAGVAVLAVFAVRAKQEADSEELAALATAQLTTDPAESVRLASKALEGRVTPEAEAALRLGLGAMRVQTVFTGHDEWVNTAAYSPDGQRVVTASDDGTVRVWDPGTGRQLALMRGHKGPVNSARFDARGARVISAGGDETARVWDASDGRRLAVVRPRAGVLDREGVALSSDGTRIATIGPSLSSTSRGGAPIWDATSGRRIRTLGLDTDVWSVAFSPDGRFVATGVDSSVRIIELGTGELEAKLAVGADEVVTHVEFSPRGRALVASTEEDAYFWRDWRRDDGRESLGDPDGMPRFRPGGGSFVTIAGTEAVVWGGGTGAELYTLSGHRDYVLNAALSRDGRAVTGSQDGSARVWSRTGEILAELRGHSDSVTDASFAPDGRTVVTAGADGTARVWETPAGRVLRGHSEWLMDAQFSRTGRRVLTVSNDGTARVWSAADGRLVKEIDVAKDDDLNAAALTPDGKWVVTAGDNGQVRIAGVNGGQRRGWEEPGPVGDVSVSDDGRFVVTAVGPPADSEALAWNAVIHDLRDPGKPTATLKGHGLEINTARFSPDGRFVVTAGLDRTARIWRASGRGKPLVLREHGGNVWTANWSSDGRRVVTAGNDGTVIVWRASSGRAEQILRGFEGPPRSAVFGHGDRWVVAAGIDGTTRIWDVESGRPLAVMHEHADAINGVAVSPAGDTKDTIVTAGDDQTARLYRCSTCVGIDELRKLAERRLRRVSGDDGG